MRTTRWAALGLLFVALNGCGLISFDIDRDLPEQKVQGNPLGAVLPSFIPNPIPLNIDIQSETKAHDTGPASHAYLAALTLSATPHASPSGNFDFLDEVHIFISSPNHSELPKTEIATLKPVPKGQTKVTFTVVPNVDLLPYINAGSQIDSTATGKQPTQDFTFDGHITVTIKI